MATPAEHVAEANRLLDLSATYPPSAAARLATLTEAQLHATLALAPQAAPKVAPRPRKAASPAKEEAK
jgi:hypothetical protein